MSVERAGRTAARIRRRYCGAWRRRARLGRGSLHSFLPELIETFLKEPTFLMYVSIFSFVYFLNRKDPATLADRGRWRVWNPHTQDYFHRLTVPRASSRFPSRLLAPLPLGLCIGCLFILGRFAWPAPRLSGLEEAESTPERGQCSGRVQTSLPIRLFHQGGTRPCALSPWGPLLSGRRSHLVSARGAGGGVSPADLLSRQVAGGSAWEDASVSRLSFLPAPLLFSVVFQEAGFLECCVFSLHSKGVLLTQKGTAEQRDFGGGSGTGPVGEQGGGYSVALLPCHLPHLSTHPLPVLCQLPLPARLLWPLPCRPAFLPERNTPTKQQKLKADRPPPGAGERSGC